MAADITDIPNIVRAVRAAWPVGDEALAALTASMRRVDVPHDTEIVRSGTVSREAYFIERGITRSVFHHDGRATTTWFSIEGDVTFGMDSLYYNTRSTESVETLEDCTLYAVATSRLDELYAAHIDIANWGRVLHQDVNRRLSHAFVDRLQLTPAERYRVFLTRFPGLANRVKLRYVADFLGMSIYTLSRIRAGI